MDDLPDSCRGGRIRPWGLVGSKPPQEEWGLCISMLMKEEDKELPAELGTAGELPGGGW